jgi:hypothetical protein
MTVRIGNKVMRERDRKTDTKVKGKGKVVPVLN